MSSALSKCVMLDGAYLELRSSLGLRYTRISVLFVILGVVHSEGIIPNSLEKRVIERRNSSDQFFFSNCESLFGKARFDYVCVFAHGNLAINTNTRNPEKVCNIFRPGRNIATNIDFSIMALFHLDSS